MNPCPWPVGRLLPHAPPMLLLDEVLGFDETAVVAIAQAGPANPFMTEAGMPAHVGIELMAQTCGAWAGANALAGSQPVRRGYLLGTRAFKAEAAYFAPGQRLEITARVVLRDQGMGVFDCTIAADGIDLATAQLTLFQPEEGE